MGQYIGLLVILVVGIVMPSHTKISLKRQFSLYRGELGLRSVSLESWTNQPNNLIIVFSFLSKSQQLTMM